MRALDKHQVGTFFAKLSIVEKQLNLDSLEKKKTVAFSTNKIEEDGDFGYSLSTIDMEKFAQCKSWLIQQLEWKPDDIQLTIKGKQEAYLYAKDPHEVINYLNTHRDISESILEPENYPKEVFFTMDTNNTSNLSGKGMAVLYNHYERKENKAHNIFIGYDKSLKSLFDMLASAQENIQFTVNVRLGQAHWVPIHCIKKEGKTYIFEMDSEGTSKDYGHVKYTHVYQSIIQSNLDKHTTHLFRTNNVRQSGPSNCGLFMVKDTLKMVHSADVLSEIQPFVQTTERLANGLTYSQYITPPRYEKTVQDRKDLDTYLKEADKLGQAVSSNELLNSTFNKVRPLRFTTVETGQSADYNRTIHHFKDKYVNRVKETVDVTPLDALKEIVKEHSLQALTLERINRCH